MFLNQKCLRRYLKYLLGFLEDFNKTIFFLGIFLGLSSGLSSNFTNFDVSFNISEAPKLITPQLVIYEDNLALKMEAIFANSCLANIGADFYNVSRSIQNDLDTESWYILVSLRPKQRICPEIYQPVKRTYLVFLGKSKSISITVEQIVFLNEIYFDETLEKTFSEYKIFTKDFQVIESHDESYITEWIKIY